jgi:FkbM family methyltransferase
MTESFYKKIFLIAGDLHFLTSKNYKIPHRKKLIWDYTRLRIKAFLNRFFNFKKEKFLNYQVSFPDYHIFFEIFRQIFIRQTYYFHSKKEDPHIIDCGGNIGMSTLYFKYIYPNSKITTFEPSKEVIEFIKENVNKNKLHDIEIVNAAVDIKEGNCVMYPRGVGACGNTLLKDLLESDKVNSYTVPVAKLSNYIKHNIDFLKLDIEGSETNVIKELNDENKFENISEIAIEFHYSPKLKDNKLSEMIHLLESANFGLQIYQEDPSASSQLELSNSGLYAFNIKAIKL